MWIVLYQLINNKKKIFISNKGCFIKKKYLSTHLNNCNYAY